MTRHFLLPDRGVRYRKAAWIALAISILLTLIRLTIRDRYLPLDVLFYATPPLVLATIWILSGLLLVLGSTRRAGAVGPTCCIALAGWFLLSDYQAPADPREAHPPVSDESIFPSRFVLRVLFWNMSGGSRGLAPAASLINSYDAHVVALVEARDRNEWVDQWWKAALPQYQVIYGGEKIVMLVRTGAHAKAGSREVRGEARQVAFGALADEGHYLGAVVEFQSRRVSLLIADVTHSLAASRKRPLAALAGIATKYAQERLIVCGDMNTPADSEHLQPLRTVCRNAFEAVGEGWPYSWPTPAPVLSLDQFWYAGAIAPRTVEIGWTLASDHQPIYAEFVLD